METHQLQVGPAATEVTQIAKGSLPRATGTRNVPLKDAAAAHEMQLEEIARGRTGPWNATGKRANSCATHVCQVIFAGGGPAPSNPALAQEYVYGLFGLKVP